MFERFRQADSSQHAPARRPRARAWRSSRHLVELHGGTVAAQSAGEGQGADVHREAARVSAGRRADRSRPRRRRQSARRCRWPPAVRLDGRPGAGRGRRPRRPRARRHDPRPVRAPTVEDSRLGRRGAVERFAAAPPDVLISDIEMPGEDGYALIRQVRALDPARGGRDARGGAHRLRAARGPRPHAVAAGLQHARAQAGRPGGARHARGESGPPLDVTLGQQRGGFPVHFLRGSTLRLRPESPLPGTLAPPIAGAASLPSSIDWRGSMTRTVEGERRREPGP